MPTNWPSSVIGVFRDRTMARQAMQALGDVGISRDQIRYLGPGSANDTSGSFFEGIRNLFMGQDTTSANVGNDLAALGVSGEEAQYYSNEYANGHSIIAVKAQGREQDAMNILQQYGAYNYGMMPGSTGTTNYGQQPSDRVQVSSYTTPTWDTGVQQRDVVHDVQPQPEVTQASVPQPSQQIVDTADNDAQPEVTQVAMPQERQRIVDTADSDAQPEVTRPVPQPSQQVADTTDSDTRLQTLQAQLQQTQRQLQEARARLQAAKEREAKLLAAREREAQLQATQKQLQDAQAQLQATLAELHAIEARLGQSNQ